MQKSGFSSHFFYAILLIISKKNAILNENSLKRRSEDFILDEREKNNMPAEGGQAGQKPQKMVKADSIVTKESLCAVLAMFAIFSILILVTKDLMLGEPGAYIHALLTGSFGYMAYPLAFLMAYNCVMGFFSKRLFKKRKALTLAVITCVFASLLAHTVQTCLVWGWDGEGYLAACFNAGETFPETTVAGWFGALPVYLLVTLTTDVGALVIFSALAVLFAYITIKVLADGAKKTNVKAAKEEKADEPAPAPNAYAYASTPAGMQQPQPYAPAQPYVPTQPVQPSQQPAVQPVQEPVAPLDGYSQGTVHSQSMSGATPAMPYVVRQTPGFTIRSGEQAAANAGAQQPTAQQPIAQQPVQPAYTDGASYSPFGATSPKQQPARGLTQEESRQILYSSTPKQNFQDNLFFDHSSHAHRRSMGGDQPASMPASAQPTVPSQPAPQAAKPTTYSEQYQQSVQDGTPIRPARTTGETELFGRRSSNPYGLDVPSVDAEPQRGAQPFGRDSGFGGRMPKSDGYTGRTTPEMPVSRGESAGVDRLNGGFGRASTPIEPPVERAETSFTRASAPTEPTERRERRHEFMDTFSLDNPRIFGATGNRGEGESREEIAPTDHSSLFDEEPPVSTPVQPVKGDDPYVLSTFDEEPDVTDYAPTVPVRGETNDEPQISERVERVAPSLTPAPTSSSSQPVAPTRMGMATQPAMEEKKEEPAPPKPRYHKPYVRVPLHYFNCSDNVPDADAAEVEDIKARIIETLEDYNVGGCTIASVTFGPTVTRYNVVLPRGVSHRKVVSLEQEIAMGLCREGVNVYRNVEDGAVSIEVPNRKRQTVELGSMFIDDEYTKAKPTSLVFAMGKDNANRKVYGDVCKMTHLLVAGSSGSGKSVFLGCLIISLITKYSPDEMRLILIDPKKTEFVIYNNLPHLMVNEIITDCKKAVQSLSWAIGEMERRYSLIEKMSLSGTYVVNIDEYNANVGPGEEKLPKIVIIVDELADLMLNAKKDIEDKIQSLTQKARAAGIHLILATQRPSTDVITGVIKSNLPTRIAFTVATDVDSRVILDQSGAQKLLGKGDMVYTASGINTPIRLQSPYISSADSQKVVQFIKENNEAYFDESATSFINASRGGGGEGGDGNGLDVEQVYLDALKLVIQTQTASISMVQRKCSVGFNKAGKIIEWMEQMEFISPYEGAKARTVYITQEKFVELFGQW